MIRILKIAIVTVVVFVLIVISLGVFLSASVPPTDQPPSPPTISDVNVSGPGFVIAAGTVTSIRSTPKLVVATSNVDLIYIARRETEWSRYIIPGGMKEVTLRLKNNQVQHVIRFEEVDPADFSLDAATNTLIWFAPVPRLDSELVSLNPVVEIDSQSTGIERVIPDKAFLQQAQRDLKLSLLEVANSKADLLERAKNAAKPDLERILKRFVGIDYPDLNVEVRFR